MQSDAIQLLVCSPNSRVLSIAVNIGQKVELLNNLFPKNMKRYIYNGCEIAQSCTFRSYGIKSGEFVIALDDFTSNDPQWLQLTRDSDHIKQKIKWMLNPSTAKETCRLRDLQLFKIENRARLYKKITKETIEDFQEQAENPFQTVLKKNCEEEPSDKPLPFVFNQEP